MRLLVKMQFGSHVYGTNVPSSDTDIKAVYVPEASDILLQRAQGTISLSTKENAGAKNSASDIDTETFALHRYLELLMSGQTGALDMFFTPSKYHLEPCDSWWRYIQASRSVFIHKGTAAFAGYCRTQANKYGIKGSRMGAMRFALEMLTPLNQRSRLGEHEALLRSFLPREHMSIALINGPRGVPEPHFEVCNRKIPFHATVYYAVEVFQRIYDEYGHRARLAEKNEGVDWKALMHAVRVAAQARELLLTGWITFPRPEAALLLRIRKGELSYSAVAEYIEQGLEELDQAALVSTLPPAPLQATADFITSTVYREAVCASQP